MTDYIAAYTKLDTSYPGYINVSSDNGGVILTVRGDPIVRDGGFVCGYAPDKGKPGRCTPGDENCNNYCNAAPQKGPMADSPKPCIQTFCGETVTIRLSTDEWRSLLAEISKGA